jgi:hypothetical protein
MSASAAPAAAQPVELVRGCLVESVAALCLTELATVIASCAQVIDDAATSRDMRRRALVNAGCCIPIDSRSWRHRPTASEGSRISPEDFGNTRRPRTESSNF